MNKFYLQILIISLVAGICLLAFNQTSAQVIPEFLVSWQAINYVPPSYQGKILPTKSSLIEVGFDLIDNAKIADLSKYKISWTLDDELFKSGLGLKTIRFNSKNTGHRLGITVSGYKGANLDKILTFSRQEPQVIIDAKIPSTQIGLGQHQLEALPYFFNVSDLKELVFDWSTNDQPAKTAENPQIFDLILESKGAPVETNLNISVSVINSSNALEYGGKKINLTVK